MSHKRGRDLKAAEKSAMIELNRIAYQSFDVVPFDAMLKCAQYAERHNLNRFAESLPVHWSNEFSKFIIDACDRFDKQPDEKWAEIHDSVFFEILVSSDSAGSISGVAT